MKKSNTVIFSIMLFLVSILIVACSKKLPDATGRNVDSVKSDIISINKKCTFSEEREFSETVEKGLVTRIDPTSGTSANNIDSVVIYVSKGKPITISDFTNSLAETAKTSLSTLGLSFTVNEEYSENVEKGNIISTNPSAGTVVETGTNIELTISKGTEYRKLPEYDGIPFNDFSKEAQELDLEIKEEHEFDESIEKGYIISCDKNPGDTVSVKTPITVIVSKGAGIAVPDLEGLKEEKAIQSLEKLGFNVETKEEYNEAPVGSVVRASVQGGDKAEEGEIITITISKGTKEDEFKSQCEEVSYDELIRNPSKYNGRKIKAKVKITEIEKKTLLGIEYDSTIWATYNGETLVLEDGREKQEPSLREGDSVTIYGYGNGTSTINVKEKKYFGSIAIGFSYNSTVDSFDVPNIKFQYIKF